MNRELSPADLLPAIERVGGAMFVQLVLTEAAREAAEREAAELHGAVQRQAAPMAAEAPGSWRPGGGTPGDWRGNGHETADVAP